MRMKMSSYRQALEPFMQRLGQAFAVDWLGTFMAFHDRKNSLANFTADVHPASSLAQNVQIAGAANAYCVQASLLANPRSH